MRVRIHIRQRPVHHLAHAQLIDRTHVERPQPQLTDHPLLVLIHRAQPHLTEMLC